MNMNFPTQNIQNENKVIVTKGWMNAVRQYFALLRRLSSKFIYFAQWTMFNFGFHIIVSLGKLNQ